jgi:putative acetyltransferase
MSPAPAIHDWRPAWQPDFERLNLDWLERYFSVEDIDRRVLGDPQTHILAPGGCVLFALLGEDVVGTVALLRHPDESYELSKMAVDPACQGRGIGRGLVLAAIERFRARGGRELFLESNRRLAPALHLYRSLGFEDRGRKPDSHYARSDIWMVWSPPRA